MHDPGAIGKILILSGILIAILGIVIVIVGKFPALGRLPGDIYIQRRNITFYVPIATSLIISLALSLLFWFIFSRK